jgi:hypothetical protein
MPVIGWGSKPRKKNYMLEVSEMLFSLQMMPSFLNKRPIQ